MEKEKDPILVILGANIRDYREKLLLSQEELAHQAGLDRSYMGGVERGERNTTLLTMVKIADALGRQVKDLVSNL